MSNDPTLEQVTSLAKGRIAGETQSWSFGDPLLFSAWMTHRLVPNPDIQTIRVGRGDVQFNPSFINDLSAKQLHDVLTFEATRILLGHPYARRFPDGELTYAASNLAVQECLQSDLPIPSAVEVLQDEQASHQYFEFYYRELIERRGNDPDDGDPGGDSAESNAGEDGASSGLQESGNDSEQGEGKSEPTGSNEESGIAESGTGESESGSQDDDRGSQQEEMMDGVQRYSDAAQSGLENTQDWGEDENRRQEIHALVMDTASSGRWGSLLGQSRVQVSAQHNVVLDNQNALRAFRRQIRSTTRQLTRTKPSRRYGFDYLGSRYQWTTKLLLAIDVSGSMSESEIAKGFSVIKKLLQQEFEAVDVVWFDADLRGPPVTFRRARKSIQVQGRGGTDFQPIFQYIDQNRSYDGLLIFTDGLAPIPSKPRNTRTRVCWLLKDAISHAEIDPAMRSLGITTFLR